MMPFGGGEITFLYRINMIKKIKKIKKIWDRKGSSGSMRSFALMPLFFFALCVSAFADDQPKVSKEEAVKIAIEATQKLRDMDHEKIDAFRIIATECSSEVNPCTKDYPDSPYIKSLRAKLKGKSYWMVAFSRKELRPGGSAVIFVDQNDGQILGKYLGK